MNQVSQEKYKPLRGKKSNTFYACEEQKLYLLWYQFSSLTYEEFSIILWTALCKTIQFLLSVQSPFRVRGNWPCVKALDRNDCPFDSINLLSQLGCE